MFMHIRIGTFNNFTGLHAEKSRKTNIEVGVTPVLERSNMQDEVLRSEGSSHEETNRRIGRRERRPV